MGRWVRWFGVEGETDGHDDEDAVSVSVVSGSVDVPADGPGEGGIRVASRAEGMLRSAPRAPTGIISIERLAAEMLTAILVREGVLTPDEEHTSLQEHRATGIPVEEVLIAKEIIEENELVSVLSRSCKVPHLSLEGYQIRAEVLDIVPGDFARANRVIPLERLGKMLNVATSNPLDIATFGKLREETGLNVKPALASPREIAACLDKFYPPPAEPLREEPPVEPASEPEAEAPTSLVDEEPAELLSDEEATAFYRSPSGAVYGGWEDEIGAGLGGELVAVPVSPDEFALFAADGPASPEAPAEPPDESDEGEGSPQTRAGYGTDRSVMGREPDIRAKSTRSERSAKTRSKKKKARKKSKKRKKRRSGR